MTSWCTPTKPKKKIASGNLIGEIYFNKRSSSLDNSDKKAIDKLADILATHPKGIESTKLLVLGDTGPAEAPKPNVTLAKQRAEAVVTYLRSKLPKNTQKLVKVEAAGKGAPFPKPPPGTTRRRIVEIINRGKPIKAAPAPLKKAKSNKEAFEMAVSAWMMLGPKKGGGWYTKESIRIAHWINGPAKAALIKGNDAYLHNMNPKVRRQVQTGSKKLNSKEWEALLDGNRILRELKEVAAYGNPHQAIIERLLSIDAGILGGIDYIMEQAAKVGAGGRGEGMWQMIRYILAKDEDWYPPAFGDVKHEDRNSIYWIYFQDIKKGWREKL